MSVAWGMKRDEAIKALTINAAEILGVADRVGSLEPARTRTSSSPRAIRSRSRPRSRNVVINGKDVGLDNKHERLYRKYIAGQ